MAEEELNGLSTIQTNPIRFRGEIPDQNREGNRNYQTKWPARSIPMEQGADDDLGNRRGVEENLNSVSEREEQAFSV